MMLGVIYCTGFNIDLYRSPNCASNRSFAHTDLSFREQLLHRLLRPVNHPGEVCLEAEQGCTRMVNPLLMPSV